jgi:hypothetical protein
MLLIIHVLAGLLSILTASMAVFGPSRNRLKGTFCLIGLTLATGTYLVLSLSAPLLSSCITGLVYLSVVVPLSFVAVHRFNKTA